MSKTVAIVLAGGRGKRMDILCEERPKPLLPFAGWLRVIDFSLSNAVHSEIGDIAVLADYQRFYLADYLRRWTATNDTNRAGRVDFLAPATGSYQGTSDAVFQNLGYLQRHGAERVLALSGDHVYKMDYRKILVFHERVKADVTVGVLPVPSEQAAQFGTVTLNDGGRITSFVEKTALPKSNLASMGIYVFNMEVLAKRLKEDAAKSDSSHDFGYNVIPSMVRQDKVYAFRFDGYWQDIGTLEGYHSTNTDMVRQRPPFRLDTGWPILSESGDDSPLPVSQRGGIRNSIISPDCVVEGSVINSVLSPGVRVEKGAVVCNAVLLANATIGRQSVVSHCILDEDTSVGEVSYLGFVSRKNEKISMVTVLGRGAVIPPHTAVGIGSRILPRVSQADFTSNIIPSGSIIAPHDTSDISREPVTMSLVR